MDAILQHLPRDMDSNGLIRLLSSRNADVLSVAVAAVGHLGIRSERIVEQLSALLLKEDDFDDDYDLGFRRIAALALAKIRRDDDGNLEVDVLAQDIQHQDIQVCARAAVLLGLVQSSDQVPPAIVALRHALDDPAVEIRRLALEALGQLGQPAVPTLIEFVRVSDDLRHEAFDAITHIGGPVTMSLIDVYEECTLEKRKDILWAIRTIHGNPAKAVPFLVKALDDPIVRMCFHVLGALGAYGPAAAEAVPRLVYALTYEYDRYAEIERSEDFADDIFLYDDFQAVSHIVEVLVLCYS